MRAKRELSGKLEASVIHVQGSAAASNSKVPTFRDNPDTSSVQAATLSTGAAVLSSLTEASIGP